MSNYPISVVSVRILLAAVLGLSLTSAGCSKSSNLAAAIIVGDERSMAKAMEELPHIDDKTRTRM